MRPDLEEEVGLGWPHCASGSNSTNNTFTGAALMHEVFNNIMLRVFLEGTKRYDAVGPPSEPNTATTRKIGATSPTVA